MYDAVTSAPRIEAAERLAAERAAASAAWTAATPAATPLPAEALSPFLRNVANLVHPTPTPGPTPGPDGGAGSGSPSPAAGPTPSPSPGPAPTPPAPPEAAEAPATPEPPGRPDLDRVLRDYQAADDEIVTHQAKVGPFDVGPAKDMTRTESELLHDLQDERGLLGLRKFRDITSNDPDDPGLAFRTADERFPPFDANGAPIPGKEDGHNDAFRHAYWNALMAKHFGEDFASAFATAHEGVPGNNADKEAMDLYNNELGRRIAREHPDASDEELAGLVEAAVRGGEAVVIDGGGELAWSDQVAVGATGSADDGPATGVITPPNDADVTSD